MHVGDRSEDVAANRAIACRGLGINWKHLVAGVQVHGCHVQRVEGDDRGRGAQDYSTAFSDTDALITNIPGVPLSSYYADCVPILLYDPVTLSVGLAHAGWRGTVQGIAGLTVGKMVEAYGSNPGDILAGIGPSIGPCCYQVDLPVQRALAEKFSFWADLLEPMVPERWKLNLWETNRRALIEVGLNSNNITTANLCTACNRDLFFSYRAEQGNTGRMASFIMIKDRL
ncbi:hypothetical protein N752_05450 [Desulforamulus aquiferis]|nr:hypothetical protein N752_05450 [Desulforamulus aquiferis]